MRVSAEHLRWYSEGLNLSNTIRMCDAFNFLNKLYEEEMKKKTSGDEEHIIEITPTERFLFNLFKGIVGFFKSSLQKTETKHFLFVVVVISTSRCPVAFIDD